MEKLIYALWRDPALPAEAWGERLRSQLAGAARKAGARHLRINLADAAVEPAAGLRQGDAAKAPQGFLGVWVDTAIGSYRRPLDEVVAALSARHAAYLVSESVPLPNTRAVAGQRTEGFSQMALLRRPPRQTVEQWLDIWHNSHTPIARETQSHFEYTQNLVVRRLNDGPDYDAIVEECFPAGAMTDPTVFFDAVGDEAKFQRNLKRMMDSVHRFIEMDRIEVLPTSQYVMY
jgi:hypothetical protein